MLLLAAAIPAALLVCILVAPFTTWSPEQAPSSRESRIPRYDWSLTSEITLAADLGQIKYVPLDPHSNQARLSVEAEFPVSVGIVPIDAAQHPPTSTEWMCRSIEVFKSESTCNIPREPLALMVEDTRSAGSMAIAAAGLLTLNANAMSKAATNKIVLQVFEWKCIAQCPQTP
jgi:hypothetical protein